MQLDCEISYLEFIDCFDLFCHIIEWNYNIE